MFPPRPSTTSGGALSTPFCLARWSTRAGATAPPRPSSKAPSAGCSTAMTGAAHEAAINRFPQFTTEIDGQTIHFIHVKSAQRGAKPLLLIHGWPGSIVEFLDLVEPLTNPAAHGNGAGQAFDVVIPSLPGFGFSGPTNEPGWNNGRIGRALLELMNSPRLPAVRGPGRRCRRHHRARDRPARPRTRHRRSRQRGDHGLHPDGSDRA